MDSRRSLGRVMAERGGPGYLCSDHPTNPTNCVEVKDLQLLVARKNMGNVETRIVERIKKRLGNAKC